MAGWGLRVHKMTRAHTRAFLPNRRDAAAAELLATVRSQLDVDGERAAEAERLIGLAEDSIAATQAETGAGGVCVWAREGAAAAGRAGGGRRPSGA